MGDVVGVGLGKSTREPARHPRCVRFPDPACGVLPAQSRHHTSPVMTGIPAKHPRNCQQPYVMLANAIL
jgi:hypothetical protein